MQNQNVDSRQEAFTQLWNSLYPDTPAPEFNEPLYNSLLTLGNNAEKNKSLLKGPEDGFDFNNNRSNVKTPYDHFSNIAIPESRYDLPRSDNSSAPAPAPAPAAVEPSATDRSAMPENPYDRTEFQEGVYKAKPLPGSTNRRFSPEWRQGMSEAYLSENPNMARGPVTDNPYDENSFKGARYRQLINDTAGGLGRNQQFQENVKDMNRVNALTGNLAQQKFTNMEQLRESGMDSAQLQDWINTRGIPQKDKPQYARMVGKHSDLTDYERTERARQGLGNSGTQQDTASALDPRRQNYVSRVANKALPQRDMRNITAATPAIPTTSVYDSGDRNNSQTAAREAMRTAAVQQEKNKSPTHGFFNV